MTIPYYGPLMLSIYHTKLHFFDKVAPEYLKLSCGYILFKKNYSSIDQLKTLTSDIQATRARHGISPALIAVDHEGGTVQRFDRDSFTKLPSAYSIGNLFADDQEFALELSENIALVLAAELGSCGINVLSGPVLDLNYNPQLQNQARAYSKDPRTVYKISERYLTELKRHGFNCLGKHFPGFGASLYDTHGSISIMENSFRTMHSTHLAPFRRLIKKDLLPGIMLTHGVFTKIDEHPVASSSFWLQSVLREKYQFNGIVVTDCMGMFAACQSGATLTERIINSLRAGCDIVLFTNTFHALYPMISKLANSSEFTNIDRNASQEKIQNYIQTMKPIEYYQHLLESGAYRQAQKNIIETSKEKLSLLVPIDTLTRFQRFRKKSIRKSKAALRHTALYPLIKKTYFFMLYQCKKRKFVSVKDKVYSYVKNK